MVIVNAQGAVDLASIEGIKIAGITCFTGGDDTITSARRGAVLPTGIWGDVAVINPVITLLECVHHTIATERRDEACRGARITAILVAVITPLTGVTDTVTAGGVHTI